jgi:hypothetical protein
MKYYTPVSTHKSLRLAGMLVVAMLVLAACQPAAAPTTVPTTAPTAKAAPTTASNASIPATGGNSTPTHDTINLVTVPGKGKYLVDSKGMTLYINTKDTADTSTCTGACAKTWPPLITTGSVTAGPGINQSLIEIGRAHV